ncbi:MAG: CFI-box-CTERM domain-containing protein [Candidatus Thiodiazotropha endolucinida]|nr:hypothetical protein [Candidatus Thiodiazotropha taylori]MCW4250843.1 hypothetical protein [Candidatus Thiodiazotropha endolucinida]MCG8104561.1 hypothetical protein [Candidatus Thiodiazotropha taylori]MCG8121837.1 hypothetical protein [Candidatus Thiodiazotropha taylori]MCW4289895.1 hypothetical protein [Candidatus Thiodiazotropha endolucinida]
MPINRRRDRNSNIVSASEVGSASYCPHYLELKHKGTRPSEKYISLGIKGEAKHKELNLQAKDQRCFVATHLYGAEDSKTCMLREFRDRKLSPYAMGRLVIHIYYSLSPYLVALSKKVPLIDKSLKFLVDRAVKYCEATLKK